MAKNRHEILRTQMVHGGWTKLLLATVRLADGRTFTREIEDHGNAACVLPYNLARRTAVLVRQFRAPAAYAADQDEMLEAVAGILEEEDPADCARREAMEEAGLSLDSVEYVFTGWTMPGISTERMHFYFAIYAGEFNAAPGKGADADEDITPVEISLAELARMADQRTIADVKTLLLVQTLRLRQPELFTS
jgi:nudix-type nucleoside diphosphatase (YffH/AdpP family)